MKRLAIVLLAVAAFGAGNMVQSNTMADSLMDALRVGRQVVTASSISATEVLDKISSYNTSFTEMQDQLDQRRQLEQQLDEAKRTYGGNSADSHCGQKHAVRKFR